MQVGSLGCEVASIAEVTHTLQLHKSLARTIFLLSRPKTEEHSRRKRCLFALTSKAILIFRLALRASLTWNALRLLDVDRDEWVERVFLGQRLGARALALEQLDADEAGRHLARTARIWRETENSK